MTEQPEKILIVDDDPGIRDIVEGAISMLGYSCLLAADGDEAIKIYDSEQPDLVILDVMMPRVSGNEVCKHIRLRTEGPLVPIIMLTAKDTVQDKVDAFEGGADDYVTKPFDYQELQARVKALLRVRVLNLDLRAKNEELAAMQEKLVENERQLVALQMAGTAAHQLGQPLSAILLNCHLLETFEGGSDKFNQALLSIKSDVNRMVELLEQLKKVDAASKEQYYNDTEIFKIK